MGLGIAERVELAGSQALVGERVDSPEQLAELAQVYRDPRYETFRVFFVKDGEVVHATGVSSRLPDQTPMVPAGMTEAQYLAQFREGMRRTGAQGYYILHNHPSGNPEPSAQDLELTEHLARQVPGMLSHVVINSNKYAVITPGDAARATAPATMVRLKYFGPDRLLQASKPMAALGQTIPSPDVLAIVGKSMQGPGWMTLVGVGSDGHVRAIAEAPSSILSRSPAYLAATVRRFVRMSGSAEVFAVGEAGDINNSPVRHAVEAGILRDAVTDLGQSLANGGRTTARPSNSAQFREAPEPVPVRMQMQRDGTLMVKGDPAQLQERLRQGGVDRVLRRKGGVVVGLDQVDKARQLLGGLQPAQPHNPAPSQGKLVAESYRSGYSSVNGRVQEPTQPDDGLGPTQGDARAAGDGALRRGGGAPLPHRTASLVGVGFAGRMEPADDQGSSQGILRRDGRTSLPRRTAALVGLGIAERIERSGSQSLLGEQVDSPQRLAELAQVYRDPRFETFRVFFVKDGVVVHATGVSSRMPGTAPMAPAGVSEQEYVNQMRDIKQKTGADSYYLLHNHPSGNPTPSPEDVGLTRMLGAHVPGLVAHVVINSNKYAVIDAANQGREPANMVRYQDFGEDRLLKASKPMAVLGEKMAGPDDLAIVGKSMQRPGWITLIGTGADGKVRAISEAPASILTRGYPYLAATVRRFMRLSGSDSVFAVGDAGDIGSKPVRDALAAGILRDALPDAGRTLHQQGVHTGGKGFSLTRGRRVAEGEPGSSSPSAVSMHTQRDGTLMVKGDPAQLRDRLRGGGVDRVLLREGGVVVGLDQVVKARQLLQQQPPRAQTSAGPSPTSQQFSRSAPDQASQARGLPSKPATVQSVRAAVAKLTNSMGLLAEGRGRVVVATSADIQAHWKPLVGEVDIGSQDTSLAQGFFDPNTNTVFLIADHIEAGQEMAVAAHELVHKHGKAVLGKARWRQMHEVIGTWANRPEGSLERRVHDEAAARVQASRPDNADAAAYSSEELFPYAVQVAMELGVQPTALMPNNSVQGWLARVRASLQTALNRLTNNPQAFDGQDLVDLAFAMAQRENPAYGATPDATTADGIDSHQRNDLPLGRKASALPEGNYAPPPIEEIVPAEILTSARETIERLMPLAVETANSDPEALAQAARELQPYLERARQNKPAFDQAVRDVATRAGALGVQLAPVNRLKKYSPDSKHVPPRWRMRALLFSHPEIEGVYRTLWRLI